jgi:hypothetical protein
VIVGTVTVTVVLGLVGLGVAVVVIVCGAVDVVTVVLVTVVAAVGGLVVVVVVVPVAPEAEITPQATRLPESPVFSVSWSGPGVPFCVYRCGILPKLSAPSWMISALPLRRSAAVNASVVVTSFPEPSERTSSEVRSPLSGYPVWPGA